MTSQLDPLTLGLVLAVLGMGGTLLTLFLLSLVMDLLKRLFPVETTGDGGQGSGQTPPSEAQPVAAAPSNAQPATTPQPAPQTSAPAPPSETS